MYKPGRPNFGHYVAAYSIEAFMDTGQIKRTMDEWIRMLKSTKPAKGHDRVLYPGQPGAEATIDRKANGILQRFRTLHDSLHVAQGLYGNRKLSR